MLDMQMSLNASSRTKLLIYPTRLRRNLKCLVSLDLPGTASTSEKLQIFKPCHVQLEQCSKGGKCCSEIVVGLSQENPKRVLSQLSYIPSSCVLV